MINSKTPGSKALTTAASLACALVLGCAQAEAPGTAGAAPAASPASTSTALGETVPLLIQGYNYTDDYIDSFTVNGQGGGNVHLSGPYTSGGGGICCVSYRPGTPLPVKLTVRWVGGYCIELETSKYGRTNTYRKGLWREAEVLATDTSNGKPRTMEIHFYADGHIEAAISDGYTPARIKLPVNEKGERPGVRHTYPRCTDDQLKQPRQ